MVLNYQLIVISYLQKGTRGNNLTDYIEYVTKGIKILFWFTTYFYSQFGFSHIQIFSTPYATSVK